MQDTWHMTHDIDGRFIYENVSICRARIGFLLVIIKNDKCTVFFYMFQPHGHAKLQISFDFLASFIFYVYQ